MHRGECDLSNRSLEGSRLSRVISIAFITSCILVLNSMKEELEPKASSCSTKRELLVVCPFPYYTGHRPAWHTCFIAPNKYLHNTNILSYIQSCMIYVYSSIYKMYIKNIYNIYTAIYTHIYIYKHMYIQTLLYTDNGMACLLAGVYTLYACILASHECLRGPSNPISFRRWWLWLTSSWNSILIY